MTERFKNEIGVEIIQSGSLPQQIPNEKTGELETVHMIQKGDAIYVSPMLYSELVKRNHEGGD